MKTLCGIAVGGLVLLLIVVSCAEAARDMNEWDGNKLLARIFHKKGQTSSKSLIE
jgi:hypothetical protein